MDQESKPNYSYEEMLERLKRSQSPGYSPRSGRKLKRRSNQPQKARTKMQNYLLLAGLVLVAVLTVLFGIWLLGRNQSTEPAGGGGSLPASPGL